MNEIYKGNKKIIDAFDHLIKHRLFADGVFDWKQRIYSLEKGRIMEKGLLTLPIVGEYNDSDFQIGTYFAEKFFKGEGVYNPNFFEDIAQDCKDLGSYDQAYEGRKILDMYTRDEGYDVVNAIDNHVAKYFALRDDLIKNPEKYKSVEEESRNLLLGSFVEYNK